MFFSLLINFFVTMYIFLSGDGKVAYLYDDVIEKRRHAAGSSPPRVAFSRVG